MTALRLYGHGYCSLCDDMFERLQALSPELGFEVEWVDIHGDPDLEARFGEDVPVLCAGERELCRHRLDESALRDFLARA